MAGCFFRGAVCGPDALHSMLHGVPSRCASTLLFHTLLAFGPAPMSKPVLIPLSALALSLFSSLCSAQPNPCAAITDNAERLACYDSRFSAAAPAAAAEKPNAAPEQPGLKDTTIAQGPGLKLASSPMLNDWGLSPETHQRSFEIRPYKPVYFLLGTHTDHVNLQPQSGNSANSVSTPINGLKANESQFQLSFKTKVWDEIVGDNGTLWLGYTQSSRWQVYSNEISRPFRETNYEPEAMLMFRTPYAIGDWKLQVSGLGINHQSNGRSNPLSRSWNRVIGHFGFERGDLSVQVRPWWRIKESASDDNNPGIENYIGRGEVILAQRFGEHVVSLQGRHSLRTGDNSRGSVKLDWAIPMSGNLKAYLSVFSGYGESMIDYNHRQTMFGAGVSLVNW